MATLKYWRDPPVSLGSLCMIGIATSLQVAADTCGITNFLAALQLKESHLTVVITTTSIL
jgi:hypothetical protein